MQVREETITPERAIEMLKDNALNRPVSQRTVDRYVADMRTGKWSEYGGTIVLTKDGRLLDGQHRLRSVVASGTPQKFIVATGAPESAFVTMDSGKTRNLSDVLAIEGLPSPGVLATIARGSYAYVAGMSFRYIASRTVLEAYVEAHPYLAEVAKLLGSNRIPVSKGSLGAAVFLGNNRRSWDAEAASFIHGVMSGEGLSSGDPRLALRDWFSAARGLRTTARSETAFAACVRAWNAYATGKELSQLKALGDPNIRTLPVFGFNRSYFSDVPDLWAANRDSAAENLAKVRTKGQFKPKVTAPVNPARGALGKATRA